MSDLGRNLLDFWKRTLLFQLRGRRMATSQGERGSERIRSFNLINISTNNISSVGEIATNHLQHSPLIGQIKTATLM